MRHAQPHRQETQDGHARRCIVTGDVRPDCELIRFVAAPNDEVVPDLAAKLPGRGMWVSADRACLERAAARNHFARAARRALTVSPQLADHVAALLLRRLGDDLGLARKAGSLTLGFDKIAKSFAGRRPPVLLIEASDGAEDGRRKLMALARAHGLNLKLLDCLNSQELSLALGRENVVHAALPSGQLADRIAINARRLAAVRAPGEAPNRPMERKAGPMPASERYE